MKKLVIASALIAATVGTASALELGVSAGRDQTSDRNTASVSVGGKVGSLGVDVFTDRAYLRDGDLDRVGVMASRSLVKVAGVDIGARAGVAYVMPHAGANGYAVVYGVGAALPLTQTLSLTADFTRQTGEKAIEGLDGNRATVGLRVKF
jgi:hypothetical protein